MATKKTTKQMFSDLEKFLEQYRSAQKRYGQMNSELGSLVKIIKDKQEDTTARQNLAKALVAKENRQAFASGFGEKPSDYDLTSDKMVAALRKINEVIPEKQAVVAVGPEHENYTLDDVKSVSNTVKTGDNLMKAIQEALGAEPGSLTLNDIEEVAKEASKPETVEDDENIVSYTYKPGDTFGQVVKDLGLNTEAGLWGPNGDVEFYNKQLEDQLWNSGVWDQGTRQNIPIGTTIYLRKRGAPESSVKPRDYKAIVEARAAKAANTEAES